MARRCRRMRANAVMNTFVTEKSQEDVEEMMMLADMILASNSFHQLCLLHRNFSFPAQLPHNQKGACSLEEKIYVIGGWNGQRGLTRCDVYDPQTQTWTPIARLNTGRYQAGVATLNGEVYAVGGCDTWNCLNTVEKYNPETDMWQSVSPMNTARRGCGVAVYKGKLYAVGGHDGVRSLCTVEIYDPVNDTWSAGPSLTNCRANVGLSLVGNRLYAVGGFNGKNFLNTIEYLDPQANEWTSFVTKEIPGSILDIGKIEHKMENDNSKQILTENPIICDQNGISEKCKEFEKQNSAPIRQNEKTPS